MILWIVAGLATILILLWIWMSIEAFGYRVREESVSSSRIPEGFDGLHILFISDIHRRKLSMASMSDSLARADLVLIGGDLTEKGVPLSRVEHNLKILSSHSQAYAVLGNHDLNAGAVKVKELLRSAGVRLLKDETLVLEKGGDHIALTGYMQPKTRKHPFSNYKGKAKNDSYHIVLVHDPIWIKGRAKLGCDLILSGHTHGGQIVLPLLGAIRLEPFYYQKYDSGWFDLYRSRRSNEVIKLLISRGFGTSHIPIRLCCPSEYHLITLTRTP
ncbi:metallophosphoesterase [Paenibacillus algicola]|uniref:Metallophosphoesterase n=1 Tax=Paenibacillus algicola TaxID=2565926 RepID=A0A4V1G3V7_9BACL|nr:metallophosphoesterase [Paenibacillus algicola]QCT02534.1 metallophosphoesterase [Paenibacillus algicola]